MVDTKKPALFCVEKNVSLVCFEGFFLKTGYYYGYDEHGRPIATSTWTKENKIYVYVKEENEWQPHWIPEAKFKAQYPNYNS